MLQVKWDAHIRRSPQHLWGVLYRTWRCVGHTKRKMFIQERDDLHNLEQNLCLVVNPKLHCSLGMLFEKWQLCVYLFMMSIIHFAKPTINISESCTSALGTGLRGIRWRSVVVVSSAFLFLPRYKSGDLFSRQFPE